MVDVITVSELRLNAEKNNLKIRFNNGQQGQLPAEFLRVESPSAEVRGHSPEQRKTIGGCRLVTIVSLEPVGHYAVRIGFSDGHDTGLFSWNYLLELMLNYDQIWNAYLTALKEKGLTRG